ncbi:MAG: heme exporter protein CcmD [Pseudomonadota bacterium]
MKEFLNMGGYAIYVWSSYARVVIVMSGNVIAAKMQRKRIINELQELSEEE